ncbi:rho GTPase-activating protein 20 isoform X5 [Hydra vulgaris]|uniref:Rho GTPase-activating protein 20 isoform X5 n=1 Tax=Hydra vulgaris TaxID=6087 RepID=A0ABM4BMA3_HYDVU
MNLTNTLEIPVLDLPVINTYAIIGTGTYNAEKKIRPLSLSSVKELRFIEQEKTIEHNKSNEQGKEDEKKKVRSLLLASTALAKFRSHAKRKDRRIGKSPGTSPQMRRKSVTSFFKDEIFEGDWCRRNLATDIDSSHKHSNDDLNYSGNNSPNSSTRRLYVQEGQVKLTYMGSTNERFMFLFNDLLLVAKAKSATTFKLKDKVRVSEIWLSAAIDDIVDTTLTSDKCFTIGWPTINYIAGFNTSEEKDLWFKTLQKCRDEQQERLELKEVTVNVINKVNQEDSYSIQTATLTVTVKHDAKAVVKMAQEQFQIQPDENSLYQLWLATKEIPYPLIGHEIPYSIKVNHSRIRDSLRDENYNPYDPIDFDSSCQFYLKKSKQTSTRMSLDLNNQRKWKNPMKKSPIYHWAMNKKTSKYSTLTALAGKLFGLPLSCLSTEEELIPKPIQNILVELFRRGPGTTGIFRKSALQRTAKQIRQNLDSGKGENMDNTSPIVLAAVIKDFFRSMPDSLISSSLYESLVATKSAANTEIRLDEIKRIFQQLPKENYDLALKFINVLYHIQRFSERNNMNSYNLSVCVSPSIMWPPPPLAIKMEATEQTSGTTDFVSFLIDSYLAIFGSENEYILGTEEEILFNDGPGEDSDSGTDQTIYRLKDETDWEKYDSEKEIDIPSTPIDMISPTKSNLDSPFALSDSSICTIDSDEVKQNPVNHVSALAMKPMLQASDKPELSENSRCDISDSENTDFNEIFQRNLLRHPKHKRVLSSITTSAELIEHRRNLKVDDQILDQKEFCKNSKSSQDLKNNSEIVPKKYVISHPVIKHFSTEYSVTPNVIFHSVDRRRQPAVPSYEEHIQKTQTMHRITKTNVRKKSIPPDQVLQLNVENYVPPVPPIVEHTNVHPLRHTNSPFIQSNTSCEVSHNEVSNITNESNSDVSLRHTNSSFIQSNKSCDVSHDEVSICNESNSNDNLRHTNSTFIQSNISCDVSHNSNISSDVSHNSNISNESNSNVSQRHTNSLFIQSNKSCDVSHDEVSISNESSSNVPKDNKSPILTFTSTDPDSTNIRPVAIESLIATFQQFSSPVEKKTKRPSVERQNNSLRIIKTCDVAQFENENGSEKNYIERSLNCVTTYNAVSVASKEENHKNTVLPEPKIITNSTNRVYLSSRLNALSNNQNNVPNLIDNEIACFNDADCLNDNNKNNNDENGFDDKHITPSLPVFINNNSHQLNNSNPFSLKLKSEVKQSPPNNQDFRTQSLQLKKTCLTQPPKKIDQLTNCSLIKESQNKIITARELRRTNRRLKKEIRNAFNDGNFIYKYSDGHKSSEDLNSYNSSNWKSENDKFNPYEYNDNNNRITNSHTSLLTQDESYV